MKRFVALLLTGLLLLGCTGTALAAETNVTVDGVPEQRYWIYL